MRNQRSLAGIEVVVLSGRSFDRGTRPPAADPSDCSCADPPSRSPAGRSLIRGSVRDHPQATRHGVEVRFERLRRWVFEFLLNLVRAREIASSTWPATPSSRDPTFAQLKAGRFGGRGLSEPLLRLGEFRFQRRSICFPRGANRFVVSLLLGETFRQFLDRFLQPIRTRSAACRAASLSAWRSLCSASCVSNCSMRSMFC